MKKVFIRALGTVTALITLIWIASSLTPYVSPVTFWPMAFLALVFPYVVPVFNLVALSWVFINKKIGLILFLLFFAAFQNISATFGFNRPSGVTTKKNKGNLKNPKLECQGV